jgi:hypothetical protein
MCRVVLYSSVERKRLKEFFFLSCTTFLTREHLHENSKDFNFITSDQYLPEKIAQRAIAGEVYLEIEFHHRREV